MYDWWKKKWGKDQLCGISQTRLRSGVDKSGRPYATTLECKHTFYTKPLVEWVKRSNTCPVCRSVLGVSSRRTILYG
jgi:hypothetical protein